MSDVKRYAFQIHRRPYGLEEISSGNLVMHSDYAKLEAEAQALRDRLEAADSWAAIASEQLKERDKLREEVAGLRARVVVVPEWQPLTGPGQVEKGDLLRFTLGGKEIEAPAQLIINAGTDKEEIVYNRGKNHYFITGMAADCTSSHKGVMVKRPNGKTVNEGLLRRVSYALDHAHAFIRNGIELGFIKMPDQDVPDPAKETPEIVRVARNELRALLGEGKEEGK